ncbi:MAG: hypothetical protein ACJ75R_07220 [Solirubrobacterales bacterium]
MNFANVRSVVAIPATMLALVCCLAAAAPADAAARPPRVIVAILPSDTTVGQIAAIPRIAPGLVSAGIGDVPAEQTYLDISQGNRVNPGLYDGDPPPLRVTDGRVPEDLWRQVLDRADGVPAELVPGLLASTISEQGIGVQAARNAGLAQLIAVDRRGAVPGASSPPPGFDVRGAQVDDLKRLSDFLHPGDLLIALAAPHEGRRLFPAGIVGDGFEGDLTSDSTRTDGVVLSTDLAPTILDRLGVEVPDEMNGTEIRAEGDVDPGAISELERRLIDRPSRDLVLMLPLVAWAAIAALVALLGDDRAGRAAFRVLGLAIVWAPFVLLVVAAADASEAITALSVGLGSVALAVAADRAFGGYLGLAVSCGVTVAAYAADVVAGSPFSSVSVLGPNPAYGVRFYGIGNELEAILTTLTVVGAGAWLATRPDLDRRRAAAWFVGIPVLAAAAFAPGRFGADVGAAIVLGVGGATAASVALGLSVRRTVFAVIAAGTLGLLALVAVDEVVGGAHFSRTVLGAGDTTQLADVFERRTDLMVHTFLHPVYPTLLVVTVTALIVGLWRSEAILAWFGDRWPARAGFVGALVGVLVGTVANDSGSVLLVIGTIYLAAGAAYAWAARDNGG